MANEQKQSMPVHSVWQQILQQKNISTVAIQKAFLEDSKELFLADIHRHTSENNYIPAKEENILRIMTFNVRMWTTLQDISNFESAIAVIKTVDPDILILQEVTDWNKTYNYFANMLNYSKVAASCITKDPCFGPAIFVKNCIALKGHGTIFENQSSPARQLSFVRVDLKLNGKPVAVYGTHLEVDNRENRESMELVRAKQLEEIFTDAKKLGHSNIIIAGDFNSVRESDYNYKINGLKVWDIFQLIYRAFFNQSYKSLVFDLFAQNKFQSSFEILQWQSPRFTNWSGRVLDFIFFAQNWNLPIVGSYVYYTDASDHLPVIADISI